MTGEEMKVLRLKAGLSQAELGAAIGMINVTERSDPAWSATLRDLLELKHEWAAVQC